MKKLFLLITLFSILSTTSYSQWWVSGGNLIWPHGNVTISKGNLNLTGDFITKGNMDLTGDFIAKGNQDLTLSSQLYYRDNSGNRIGEISGEPGSNLLISFGDLDGVSINTKLTINDNEIHTTNLVTDELSLPSIVIEFDVSDPPVTSEIDQINLGPDNGFKIIRDSDTGKHWLIFKFESGSYFFVEIRPT